MTDITTRTATAEDIEPVAVLFDAYRQFYAQGPDLDGARRFVADRLTRHESVVLIAEDDSGRLLGFCQMYPTFCSVEAAPVCALYDLYVSPSARRGGIGKALLLAAEVHARQQGCVRMDLTTARSNSAAQSLYESLGWVRDTVFYAYSRKIGV